jgi:hypothetical protein
MSSTASSTSSFAESYPMPLFRGTFNQAVQIVVTIDRTRRRVVFDSIVDRVREADQRAGGRATENK